jgi:heptose-I-phosphate ethanolaminephosphotransferase
MKKGFLTNKYTLSVFILLAILATDILLHKGMSRVIIPESFTDKRLPQKDFSMCEQVLAINGKNWLKGINTTAMAAAIDSNTNGIEMDVYFDTSKKVFFVYHDTDNISRVNAEEIFSVIKNRNLDLSIWLDFKNLFQYNEQYALAHILDLKKKYSLEQKLVIESPNIQFLQSFCDSGFFTSFYVPFFNPYQEEEQILNARIDSLSAVLKKYPVSALSGYYFQVPFLKKFFPAFPLLTWTDESKTSLVNKLFNRRMDKDDHVKIVLHPFEN